MLKVTVLLLDATARRKL